jgi:hypothetical protein
MKTYSNTFAHFNQHVALIRQDFVHELSAEENHDRESHKNSGETKTEWIAVVHVKALDILAKNRSDEGWNEATEVDREVEHGEEDGKLLRLFWHLELFTTESSNAWLDTSTAKSDEWQSDERQRPE